MTDPVFLLDSNVCIYILTDAGSPSARCVQAKAPGTVVVSAIVAAEVMRGIDPADAAAMTSAERFFRVVPIMPFDAAAARAYARLPFRRGQFDRLIAAHALALDLTVVTANEADFADIPGLRVENWTLPTL